ncbi:MAG: TonB-dependent siderophore receptor [Pseudomonadota bacterium]|nr:TonB-dependent siderophore receptor [Pseudomonadota bacterium]
MLLGAAPVVAADGHQDEPVAGGDEEPVVLPVITVTGTSSNEIGYVATQSATATKTDTPIIETPQSISVVTRDRMEAQNAQSVSDALRYTAGVVAESNGPDPRSDEVTIRGLETASSGSQYRDGLRDFAFGGQGGIVMEPYGLERIEVLRGPASVLYGQGAPGGLINLITKRPTQIPLYEIQLQYGSFDRKQAAFDLSGPIDDEGRFLYRLTGLARDADSQIDFVTDDRIYFAPALTWQPSNDTRLTLLASYQENERGQGYQALPRVGTLVPGRFGFIATDRFVGEPGFDRFDQERTSLGYEFEHHLNSAWSLRQNFRWMDQETLHDTIFFTGLQDDGATIDRAVLKGREWVRHTAIDNQVRWRLKNSVIEQTVLFGLDHQRLRGDFGSMFLFSSVPSLDVYNPVYGQPLPISNDTPPDDTRNTLTQTGLYVQDQLKLYDKWVLSLGGRYDWADSGTEDLLADTKTDQDDEAFTGRAGLLYLADNGLAPYFSYSESFLPIADTDFFGEPFEPETGEQYEVGVKYQPPGANAFVTLAAFDLRRQNVLTQDPENFDNLIQTGEVRSRGIEVEAVASLDFGLDLILAYTYLDPEITKSNVVDDEGERIEEGETPTGVPEHTASLWADYTIQGGALAELGFGAGVRYRGSTFGDVPNTIKVPDVPLVDAVVHYSWKNLYFALNASNLFDEEYVAFCGFPSDGCKYGNRRFVAATLTYRW